MTKTTTETLDSVPLNRFHVKVTIYSSGGTFLDGYILGIIGVALIQASPQLGLTPVTQGLVGAAALAGIFFGASIGGMLGDRFGRQQMYMYDLLLIALVSAVTFWVDGAVALIVMRLIVGIVIGADIPLASALVTEFLPMRYRGPSLAILNVMFFVGAAIAYMAGHLFLQVGDDGWRWMLASAAAPALLIALLRIGTPESPRWLVQQGRLDEARAVTTRVAGGHVAIPVKQAEGSGLQDLIRRGYTGRVVFAATFWTCSIIPLYALYAFGPQILGALGLADMMETFGSAMLQVILTLGCVIALLLINRVGRRPMLIVSFGASAIPLLILWLFPAPGATAVLVLFALYALALGGSQILQLVYPNELFPTQVRGVGVGVASACSRIGAAIGTFVVPMGITHLGIATTMLIAALITLVGFVVSVIWAPETLGLTLDDAASAGLATDQRA